MSTSFYAKALIGIEVDVDRLIKIDLIRGCSCKEPPEKSMKFCSNCGRKAWIKSESSINGFDLNKSLFSGFNVVTIYGLDTEDKHFYCIERLFIVGAGAETGNICYGGPTMCSLPENISDIKEELKKILEPIGFWDESKFGLWAIGSTC